MRRESDHDCLQPHDDFIYAIEDVDESAPTSHADERVKDVEKNKGNGLDSLGGGKLV